MEDKRDDDIDADDEETGKYIDEQYQARCYDFYWSIGTRPFFFMLKKL